MISIPRAFPFVVKKGNSTVKIYRIKNKGYKEGYEYTVSFYQGGKRKRETFKGYGDAKKRADGINDSIANGDIAALSLSADDRIYYQRAIEALKPSGISLDRAATDYAAAIKKLGNVPLLAAVDDYVKRNPASLTRKSVKEVYAEMIGAKEKDGLSKIYVKDLKFRVGKFSEAFGMPLLDTTTSEVNAYLRSLKGSGRGRNNHRMAIGTLYKFAESQGYVPRGHIDFEQIAKAKESQSAIDIFKPDEIGALLTHAGPGLTPFIALGGFAGLRNAEIMRQDWGDIYFDRGFIRVTGAKGNTAQKRLVPIQDNLKQWLLPYAKQSGVCCS